MRVVYGIDVLDEGDEFIRIAEDASESTGTAAPGRFLVDMIPICKW